MKGTFFPFFWPTYAAATRQRRRAGRRQKGVRQRAHQCGEAQVGGRHTSAGQRGWVTALPLAIHAHLRRPCPGNRAKPEPVSDLFGASEQRRDGLDPSIPSLRHATLPPSGGTRRAPRRKEIEDTLDATYLNQSRPRYPTFLLRSFTSKCIYGS